MARNKYKIERYPDFRAPQKVYESNDWQDIYDKYTELHRANPAERYAIWLN